MDSTRNSIDPEHIDVSSSQTRRLIDLWPIFAWMFLFMISNGVGITVMPVLAVLQSIPNWVLGIIGAIYFAGMFLGYFIGPPFVRAIGYKSSALLLLPIMFFGAIVLLTGSTTLWAAGRCLAGLGVGVSYIIAESWVAARAHSSIRMTALSIYITAAIFGILAAQAALTRIDPSSLWAMAFGVITIIVASALIAIAPVPEIARRHSSNHHGRSLRIIRGAVVPLFGVFVSGILFSIFVTFYPAFGAHHGMTPASVPLIGVIVMAGAAFVQPILGRLAEHVAAYRLLMIVAIGSSCASIGLVMSGDVTISFYVLIAIWGATALTTYPLYGGLAYAALPDEPTFDVARIVLIAYGVAEIAAPPLMGVMIDVWGADWLFRAAALFGGLLAAIILIAQRFRREAATRE